MKYTLLNLLMEAIENDFWNEDSLIIEKYAEGEEEQCSDCEGICQYINKEGKAEIKIGNKKYIVSIEEQLVNNEIK